jgi:hypothetical protein
VAEAKLKGHGGADGVVLDNIMEIGMGDRRNGARIGDPLAGEWMP